MADKTDGSSSPELTDPFADPIDIRVINESLKATTLPVFPEEPVGPTPEEIAAKQVTKIRSVELALEYVNITSGTFEPPDPTVGYVISVATDFYNYIIAP